MTQLTRRGFITRTSLGAATVGALVSAPVLATAADASAPPVAELSKAELNGPIVMHVRNLSTGEIALMVGTREIVFRDRRLVTRLVKAAR